jgi:hypothetical protein
MKMNYHLFYNIFSMDTKLARGDPVPELIGLLDPDPLFRRSGYVKNIYGSGILLF